MLTEESGARSILAGGENNTRFSCSLILCVVWVLSPVDVPLVRSVSIHAFICPPVFYRIFTEQSSSWRCAPPLGGRRLSRLSRAGVVPAVSSDRIPFSSSLAASYLLGSGLTPNLLLSSSARVSSHVVGSSMAAGLGGAAQTRRRFASRVVVAVFGPGLVVSFGAGGARGLHLTRESAAGDGVFGRARSLRGLKLVSHLAAVSVFFLFLFFSPCSPVSRRLTRKCATNLPPRWIWRSAVLDAAAVVVSMVGEHGRQSGHLVLERSDLVLERGVLSVHAVDAGADLALALLQRRRVDPARARLVNAVEASP